MNARSIPPILIGITTVLVTGCAQPEAQGLASGPPEQRASALDRREAELNRRETRLASLDALSEPKDGPLPALTAPAPVEPPPLEPEPAPGPSYVTLPASTRLQVEFVDGLSSETNVAGDTVRARLDRDVFWAGSRVIPAGSELLGRVVDSTASRKIGGQATLVVEFEQLRTADDTLSLQAELVLEGKGQKKKDAATIGGSAAGGAVLGRVLGKGDKGKATVIGAVLGAAVGTAVAAKNPSDPVIVEPGAVMALTLGAPLTMAVPARD